MSPYMFIFVTVLAVTTTVVVHAAATSKFTVHFISIYSLLFYSKPTYHPITE
jgi:hypothetical protein